MWTSNITREDLISLTQNEQLKGKTVRSSESLDEIETPHGLVGVWSEKPEDWKLPNLLLLESKDKAEFFAWANSYLKVKPLTAFVRVVDFEALQRLSRKPPKDGKLERAILGLVLGEALTYIEQVTPKLSLRACLGTYSFAAGKSLSVSGLDGLLKTGQNWFRSREVLGNRGSRLALFHLQGVWSVVEQLIRPTTDYPDIPPSVVRSCKHLFDGGEITDTDWRELTKDTALYDLRFVMLDDTREERVKLLEDLLQRLSGQVRVNVDMAFLVGYLISMIAPGSLDHWRLLNPVRNSIPTSGLWYGLCAGLRPSSRLYSYSGGIGRLVARELHRKVDILEEPTCDIAVDELDVTGPFFKTEGSNFGNTIEVEISPGVSTPFRSNGAEQTLQELKLQPPPPSVPDAPIDPATIEILDDAIYALQDVRRNLQKAIPYSQRGFFKKSRKKRSSR